MFCATCTCFNGTLEQSAPHQRREARCNRLQRHHLHPAPRFTNVHDRRRRCRQFRGRQRSLLSLNASCPGKQLVLPVPAGTRTRVKRKSLFFPFPFHPCPRLSSGRNPRRIGRTGERSGPTACAALACACPRPVARPDLTPVPISNQGGGGEAEAVPSSTSADRQGPPKAALHRFCAITEPTSQSSLSSVSSCTRTILPQVRVHKRWRQGRRRRVERGGRVGEGQGKAAGDLALFARRGPRQLHAKRR